MVQVVTDESWFVIVNPTAGSGKGLDDFPRISKLLRSNGIIHETVFTEHKFHATELTVSAVNRGFRHIIIAGGDGTLHEVVNGLFIQQVCAPTDVTLAVIAVGTGNDWVRTFGIPTNYAEAIRAIKEGNTFVQDTAEVEYEEAHYRQKRYMANSAGVGFDAKVVRQFNHLKAKGHRGTWLYIRSLVGSYFRYKSAGAQITVDGKVVYNNLVFSISVGICKYKGGGLQTLPKAVPDDGLLDVTIIRPVHWWNIVFRAKKLSNGDIYSIGHTMHLRGREVRIYSSPDMPMEIDGELFGHTPLTFSAQSRKIKVIVSQQFAARHIS